MSRRHHLMPFGAEVTDDARVRFRLWAPHARRVELCLEALQPEAVLTMAAEDGGWFGLITEMAGHGTLYRYCIDNADLRVPDPASRFQPRDVHGPSQVIDASVWDWQDDAWRGRPWHEAVIYELHVGSFTPEGTFAAVAERLDHLAQLGVTAIELMPVNDFPGERNWGYDGVFPFAPDSRYGTPDDLKGLIQRAHAKGLMVFLDVVYNHFGPEGNYLHRYAPPFFTKLHHTPWGDAINFDDRGSAVVRNFFVHNALYWLEEYHLDGLRLDAVHAILDDSHPDILEEVAQSVRARIPADRHVHLVLENDNNAAHYLRRNPAGQPPGYIAQWNDDVHHALHCLLTGEHDGYYADYADAPLEHLGRCLTQGFAYQGAPSPYRHGRPRGEPSAALPPTAFISFLQNHDQVGNRALGERITALAGPEAVRAAMAVLLLAPAPPLLFMGQEWGAPQPFLFFCDFSPDLAPAVAAGRRREFARYPAFSSTEAQARIPDPNAPRTFATAVLDWSLRTEAAHRGWLAFHRHLLALRREFIVPRLAGLAGGTGEFRQLADRTLEVSWTLTDGAILTLLANLGEIPATGLAAPGGEPFYTTGDNVPEALREGRLPAWSVAWWLTRA